MSRIARAVVITALSAATFSITFSSGSVHADQPAVYVVKQGDSLFGIAGKLKVAVNDLLAANGMTLTSVILPGQQLQVPGNGGATGTSASSGSYTVRAGDSLSIIAKRHGVSLESLLSINSMTATSLILPGQSLALPGGAVAPSAPQQPAGGGATYAVKAGDSLSAIARRHGVTLGALLTANSMTVTSLIVPGQTLKLPAGVSSLSATQQPASQPTSQPGTTGATYTIKAGDSLSGIAQRHHITLAALLATNSMTVSSLILPGQTLSLPAGTAAPAATPAATPGVSDSAAAVVAFAQAQLGKPYVFNTAGPDTYDCSGLTKAAFRTVGVSLVHQSSSQARQGTAVDFINEPIKAGDLIFLATRGNETINHVGIAVSSTQYIHAASPAEGVKISKMPSLGSIVAVRRMI